MEESLTKIRHYYFKQTETEILKYVVTFNRQEIEELKEEIIEKCGKIIHYDYLGTIIEAPNLVNMSIIRNYKQVKLTQKKENGEILYNYTYDLYKPPYITSLIKRLLNNDMTALDKIYDPIMQMEQNDFSIELNYFCDKMKNFDKYSIEEKQEIIDKLKNILNQLKPNEDREPVDSYYLKLQNLIQLDLIEKINISDIEKINSFYENKLKRTKIY